MASTKDHIALLKQAVESLVLARQWITQAFHEAEMVRMELETGLEQPVEPDLQSLPLPSVPVSRHRREHRPGRPGIISADPALQAFVTARLERMTFDQIAADVALHFPPERRVRKTAIHRWWQDTRKPKPR